MWSCMRTHIGESVKSITSLDAITGVSGITTITRFPHGGVSGSRWGLSSRLTTLFGFRSGTCVFDAFVEWGLPFCCRHLFAMELGSSTEYFSIRVVNGETEDRFIADAWPSCGEGDSEGLHETFAVQLNMESTFCFSKPWGANTFASELRVVPLTFWASWAGWPLKENP